MKLLSTPHHPLKRRETVNDANATTESPLATWAAQIASAIEVLEKPMPLPPVPQLTGDGEADAAALLDLLSQLECNPQTPLPGGVRNTVFQARAAQALRWTANAIEENLMAIDRHLAVLAANGAPGLLTAHGLPTARLAPGVGGVYAAVDMLSLELPAGHPVRSLVARSELFGDPPQWFILGPLGRAWYSAAEAAALTRRLAVQERQRVAAHRAAVQADLDRQEARNKAMWEASPAGRAAAAEAERRRLEERLGALEAAGAK
jgi:hypothetical protein